jgi:hypothetical protein
MRHVSGQPAASVGSEMVVRQRRPAGDHELGAGCDLNLHHVAGVPSRVGQWAERKCRLRAVEGDGPNLDRHPQLWSNAACAPTSRGNRMCVLQHGVALFLSATKRPRSLHASQCRPSQTTAAGPDPVTRSPIPPSD